MLQVSLEPLEDVLRQLRTDPVQVCACNIGDDDDDVVVVVLLLNLDGIGMRRGYRPQR
jgi:hypothetical protein